MKTENQKTGRRRQSGVTLIEMLVVVTIIALFVGPGRSRRCSSVPTRRAVTAARAQINGFMTALGAYKLDTSTFPTTEQGLQALARRAGRRAAVEGSVSAAGRAARSLGPIRTSTSIPASMAMSPTSFRSARMARRAAKASTRIS